MNHFPPEYSKEKILKNVKYTTIWAAIIFVIIVLPAEYGKDPTWFWKLTWLNKLAPNYQVESIDTVESSNAIESDTSVTQDTLTRQESIKEDNEPSYDYQELEKTYTLKAWRDTEVKFKMYKWGEMTFDWQSTGTVYLDQHWEPTTSEGKAFLPYKSVKEWRFESDSGTLRAEFTGTHGWYWRNLSNEEITIKLTLKGNFK
jgi:hypothetical protein